MLVALARVVALRQEEAIDLQEVGPRLGQGHALDAVGQPTHPAGVRRERQHLRQHRQPFLRDRGRRRPLAQERADRLTLAVQRRAQVDPAFVDFQQPHLARREAGVAADLDVVAAGRRVGHDAVGQPHAHRRRVLEEARQPLRQDFDRLPGVQRRPLPAEQRLGRQVVEHVGHHLAEVGQGRSAGVEAVGRCRRKDARRDRRRPVCRAGRAGRPRPVFLAHARHHPAGGVVLAERRGARRARGRAVPRACGRGRRAGGGDA